MENCTMNKHNKEVEAARLRRTAEQFAVWTVAHPMHAETDSKKLLHELQVHHIELEMQNAELYRANAETESALKKVTALNEDLKQSIDKMEAISNSNKSAKRALIVSMSDAILEPLNMITIMTNQMRKSGIDSKLVEQLDRLQLASRAVLKSINSF